MIGDLEKSSFNNIEQQSLEFVKYTLDPWGVPVGAVHGALAAVQGREKAVFH